MTDHLISALFGTARRKKKPLLQGGSQPATSLSHACVSLRRSNEKKMRLLFFFFFFFFFLRSVTRNGPTSPWTVEFSLTVIGRCVI